MASFFAFPPEVRQMIYNCLVEESCRSSERIVSDLRPGSLWSSKPCELHGNGICSFDSLRSTLHHAPVGDLLSLKRTNSLIRDEAEATLVEGADLTIRASLPGDGSHSESFIVIMERFSAILTTQMRGEVRSLRLDQSEAGTMIFGILNRACCAILMTNLSRLYPSLERLYLFLDVGLPGEEGIWASCVGKKTAIAVEGLAAGSKTIQLWLRCAPALLPENWHSREEVYAIPPIARQIIENRLDELRNAYAATRKKQRDRPNDRASHYDACFDGSYLVATKRLRSLAKEDSE